MDEAAVSGWLERILETCLAGTARCQDPTVAPRSPDERARWLTVDTLLVLLGEVGSARAAPLLLRLDARGMFRASTALDRIRVRAMDAALPSCAPPSAAEVATARATLGDFAAVRVCAGRLLAEAPTAVELDDLAYLLASTEATSLEVGSNRSDGACTGLGPRGSTRVDAEQRFDAARLAGDLAATVQWGRAYLETFGFPGPICTAAATPFAWGGARFSYVMRDVAEASELLGRFADADALWRRANPGGGACGTSASYIWQTQVRGAIRASERAGRCRAALPERLLALDGADDAYGPRRLAAAGFDVERLYRGALVTIHRDAEPADLERARSPPRRPRGVRAL